MLRKILEVFITKNVTQCKASSTLKIDLIFSKILDNKNIGKLFLKYELIFLDQASSSSDLSQTLILRFLIPRVSLPLSSSLFKFYLSQLKLLLNTIVIMFLTGFPLFSYPIQPRTQTTIGYTKPYANKANQIY